jgi:hypothetical protein
MIQRLKFTPPPNSSKLDIKPLTHGLQETLMQLSYLPNVGFVILPFLLHLLTTVFSISHGRAFSSFMYSIYVFIDLW